MRRPLQDPYGLLFYYQLRLRQCDLARYVRVRVCLWWIAALGFDGPCVSTMDCGFGFWQSVCVYLWWIAALGFGSLRVSIYVELWLWVLRRASSKAPRFLSPNRSSTESLSLALGGPGCYCHNVAPRKDIIQSDPPLYIRPGYVFMFITLTLIPVLIIMGLMRGKTKLLCWRQCRCAYALYICVFWVQMLCAYVYVYPVDVCMCDCLYALSFAEWSTRTTNIKYLHLICIHRPCAVVSTDTRAVCSVLTALEKVSDCGSHTHTHTHTHIHTHTYTYTHTHTHTHAFTHSPRLSYLYTQIMLYPCACIRTP